MKLFLSMTLPLMARAFLIPHHATSYSSPPRFQQSFIVLRESTNEVEQQAPEVLATEGEWSAYLDTENTGLVYYFNRQTGQALWEPPTKTFPEVKLRGSKRRQAREKQEEYVKSVQQEQQEEPKAAQQESGFFSNFGGGQEKKEVKEESNWFGNLFEEVVEQQQKEPEPVPKQQEVQQPKVEAEPVAEPEPVVEEAPTEEPGPGFFQTLFARAEETVQEAPTEKLITPTVADEDQPIKIEMSTYVLAHPAKRFWGGEDAVFAKGRTFGVFDGVSGANKLDGLPLYSRTLANVMKQNVGEEGLTIRDLTARLLEAAETADKKATGASTAVVASINEDGYLRALNLGDSACMVIRDGRVVGKTREISHYFECPYQLSTDSPDRPKDGTKLNIELMRGDLVFMASDGVFDNLDDETIVETVMANKSNLSTIAKKVSDLSRKTSFNQKAVTPYAKLAKKFGDPAFTSGLGGKVDDISCVVVKYE